MNKRDTLRRALALLCCMAMLLPCVPATLAAGDILLDVNFESYADTAEMSVAWGKGGTAANNPQLSTERAFSGKQSILVEDAQSDKSIYTNHSIKQNNPAGTELILSAMYFLETKEGSGNMPYLNFYAGGNNQARTYSVGKWDPLSVIITTASDNQTLGVLLGSDTPPITKTYWDDVKAQVLTQELALQYVDEKLFITGFDGLYTGLATVALGLNEVDSGKAVIYGQTMKNARTEKGSALTKAEIQACVDKVNAGGGEMPPLLDEDFENYVDESGMKAIWSKGGNSEVNNPALGTDKAFGGKQSLLVEDTESDKSLFARGKASNTNPAGTELILTARYFVEKMEGGGTLPYLNLYANGNHMVYAYSTGKWDTLSAIAVTETDKQTVTAILGSNTPPMTKTYWDDVKMMVLTEELAVAFVNEKAAINDLSRAEELMSALNSKALSLSGVDAEAKTSYLAALQEARASKGSDLTRAEIQNCIDNVSMDALAKSLADGSLAVGKTGDISAAVVEMPGNVKAEWVSVSPANKNIAVSGGKATAKAIPTGADDVYTAVLRLSTADKSVNVNYTIRLVNEDGLNKEEVNAACDQLVDTVIGTAAAGVIAAPKTTVAGVSVKWDRIKTDPYKFVELSGGQLSVKAIPDGLAYYEATVVLKLTKGGASAEVEYSIIAYNDKYQTLMALPNAGMENVDKSGHPIGWSDVVVASVASYAEGSDKTARTGNRSAHIVDNDPEINTSGIRLAGGNGLPAKAGYEYVGTFWAKGTTTAEAADRAGVATYVEYWNGGSRQGAAQGPAITANNDDWTLVSMWSMVESKQVGIMAYSFVNTVCDVFVDDFRIWELTPAGSALATDALLTGKGDADSLYARLSIKSLGISGLDANMKADYLNALTAKRAAKGSPLTAEELAAGVKEINDKVTSGNKAALDKLVSQIKTKQTVSQTGVIALPAISDSTISAKYTAVSGTGASRITLTGVRARVDSLPANGKKDETASLTLTLTKGSATVNVNIELTLKAYTKGMTALAEAAKGLNISDYLNGQSANFVTSDLSTLPASVDGGIAVKWQALDSATLTASKAVTDQGKVTRPAFGQPDASVALRATLSKSGESYVRDLYLIVPALGAEDARMVIDRNPDFETEPPMDEFANPDGWLKNIMWADGKSMLPTSYANIDSKLTYTGNQAMRIDAEGKKYSGQESAQASVRNSAVTTVREGLTYTLEVMVYTDSDVTNPSVTLTFLDNEGLEIAAGTTATYEAAPGERGVWKNLTITAVAPAGAVFANVDLQGGTVAGSTRFDDVRLREWPIVTNGDFELGTIGWTTAGTAAEGKLALAAGQTAVSAVRAANRGVTYYLSLEADSGKAALRFVDKDGKTLAEYAKDMKSGLNAFFAYAPANTAGVQVVLSGAMTADNVKITRGVTGTGVTDSGFEISAGAGVGTPWDLTNASIAANTGKTGAGLTVKGDGKAQSTLIPVEDGKGYIFSADVKGKGGTMTVVLYNFRKQVMNSFSVTADKDGWNTLDITFAQLIEAINSTTPEHAYAQIVLSGNAVFDNVDAYSTAKTVSEASMENTKVAPYGTFPHNWKGYGKAAAYVANQPGQYTDGVKGLAVELFGIGEGGVRSSLIRDAKSGKAYEATVMAKGSGAKLSVEFWDGSFNKLGSESVTINSAEFKEYSVVGTAPSGTIYATLSVGGSGSGLVYIDQASVYPVVRSIGNNVQLFLDDWLIADSQNVKRTLYRGEELDKSLRTQVYSYHNIQWDEKEQVFKMWSAASLKMRYCTSKDGVNWTPLVPGYNKDTGEVMPCGYVVIDDDEPDPNKRYKAIVWNEVQSRTDGSYDYWSSADGIYWTFEAKGVRGQDVVTMVYDPYNDEYLMTYKISTSSPASTQNKRTHSTVKSKDLINWTEGVRQYSVGTPDDTIEQNMIRTDGYGNGMYALGDSYVSLNWRFILNDADSFGGQLDSNMLFSRNLEEDWLRLEDENGNAFLAIPRGAEGEPDDAQIYTAAAPIQVGDETWWHYYGLSGDHGYAEYPRTGYGSAVKWRRNGFGSMDFSAGGTMTTEQFTMMGSELHLNAKGNLTVELLDANGAVVATAKFSGDSVDAVLTWDKDISAQQGKVVSLRFTSSDAKLYTLQWQGSIFSDVAEGAWYHRAVHYAVDNGIMGGYGGGKFGPNDTLTRAMVIQMLYNKVGQPKIDGKHEFTDVPTKEWFNNAVTWGTRNGVMGGYGGGKFGPNDNVTIEQIAVILWNYSGNPDFNAELGNVGKYDGWAANGLTWARDNGILHGVNFKNATDNATRAQAAQMLTNFLRR